MKKKKPGLYISVAKFDEHIGHVIRFKEAPAGRLVRVNLDEEAEAVFLWTEGAPFPKRHFAESAVSCSCGEGEQQ